MTTPANSLITHPIVPATLLSRRCYGNLDLITDSERRALRSIGTTAGETAAKTGTMLPDLLALPGVRIFRGVRSAASQPGSDTAPRIPHVINTGRRVVLVESVTWPVGNYTVLPNGRIHCDEVYIGQSVRPLISAVRYWRATLPRDHRVSALIIVHPIADGALALPQPQSRDLAWARADNAVGYLLACLLRGPETVSVRAVAELVAATAEEELR